jgi:hypothetical protein
MLSGLYQCRRNATLASVAFAIGHKHRSLILYVIVEPLCLRFLDQVPVIS